MIVDKIYQMLDSVSSLEEPLRIPTTLLNEFLSGCEIAVKRQFTNVKEEAPTIRLSAIGKCLKQQAFTAIGEQGEEIQPRARFTFFFGDLVEEMIIFLAKLSGVNLHSEQKEVVLDKIKGHVDGIADIDGERYIVECKSMSDLSFKDFRDKGMTDDWGYISQINAYMEALNINKAILVGVNKNTGHLHEQVFEKDDNVVAMIYSNIQDLKEIQKNPEKINELENISLVEETYRNKKTGNRILSITCSYCKYKNLCWKGLVSAFRNGKPIFYIEPVNFDTVPQGTSFQEI